MPGVNFSQFSPGLTRSLSEKSLETLGSDYAGTKAKRRYVLVRLEEEGAKYDGHLATVEDTEQLSHMLNEDDVSVSPALSFEASSDADTEASERSDAATLQSLLPPSSQQCSKPGGPCDHCGAVESPQWRRGPASKPMLCNACGTRYRRTNQLGAPVPSTRWTGKGSQPISPNKKRSAGSQAASPLSVSNSKRVTNKKARCVGGSLQENYAKAMVASY
mmetsp:Transcript_25053/g.54513  ORF Transcript_25053/g.54513 Transcript_25053/m.54513 type:complete len:218 (-) Transcript_25053:766-1419(-)|eukprot:CAMPEP_0118932172 /NCGR_PEP_ID=MMETSP1169-20130426/9333_1 /TAXON_ID=36882 /ORGANISM="Pyramimonas obovata, Strain CCMP722" /LENGTH=217 /DNA_ID=CAMNT_0006874789 /DNA_START=107 /DNA_END=760 /DNA_ORIENTATION=+